MANVIQEKQYLEHLLKLDGWQIVTGIIQAEITKAKQNLLSANNMDTVIRNQATVSALENIYTQINYKIQKGNDAEKREREQIGKDKKGRR